MKPAPAKPTPGHHRCFYRFPAGRQCRSWVIDPRGMFCRRHCAAQPNGPDDFALHLLQRSCNFQNAQGIHDSVQSLYTLLAADAISPRRAAVLGYLASLLIRTLPVVYKDPFPEAGTPMSAAQLAEREKAKSLVAIASEPPVPAPTQKRSLAKKAMPAQRPVPTQNSAPRPSSTPTPQPQPPADPVPATTTASTPEHLGNGPGRPMPATRAVFAAQVLKSLPSTPPTSTPVNSAKPNPTTISPAEKELSSPLKPPPSTSTSKAPDENISQPASAPANHSINKKSYQARLHTNINWPVTGSPPPWGWTTDP